MLIKHNKYSNNNTCITTVNSKCTTTSSSKITVLNYYFNSDNAVIINRFQGLEFNSPNNINAIYNKKLYASPAVKIIGENIHLLEPGIYNFNMNIIIEGSDEIEYIAFSMIKATNGKFDFTNPLMTERFPTIIIGQLSTTMSLSIINPTTIRIINTSLPRGLGKGNLTLISKFNPKATLTITSYTLGYQLPYYN